ncbi:MFS transporter [Pimelobacter simplex]|uniref:MFS transporter n=1 Tax=Nocardioides simplex TaxID=2045 RepID=UPI003AB0000A
MSDQRPGTVHRPEQAGTATAPSRPVRAGLLVAVLAVGTTAFGLIPSLTYPALPHLRRAFDTDQSTITWVVTAYLASAAVATPVLGRLGDLVGRGRLLLGCLVLLSLGSLLAALAPSVEVLIAARVVQGAGGGLLPLSYAIVREHLPPARSPAVVGLLSSLIAISAGVGIVIAGPVIDAFGYRVLFWIPLAATGLAAAVAVVVMPRGARSPGESLPMLSAALFGTGMVAGLVALSQGAEWGWTSARVLLLALTGVAALVAQWLVDRGRGSRAFMDPGLLRLRSVALGHAVGFLAGFGMYASFAFVAPLLQAPVSTGFGFGVDTSAAGLMMLPGAVCSFVGGIVAPRWSRRSGTRTVLAVASLVAAAGMAGIALASGERVVFLASYGAVGLGTGATLVCLTNHLLAAVPPAQLAAVTGMNANLRTVGGAVGTAVLAAVVTDDRAYPLAFGLLAVVLVAGAIFASRLPALPKTLGSPT